MWVHELLNVLQRTDTGRQAELLIRDTGSSTLAGNKVSRWFEVLRMSSSYLEREQLERPNTAPHHRLGHGLVHHLNGRFPTIFAGLFA
jgi:hypothetical protein